MEENVGRVEARPDAMPKASESPQLLIVENLQNNRSKISCKLFLVMQFRLHFTNLQENLPKTPVPCVNSLSLTIEQQNGSPCGPIQLVEGISFWNQLPPIQTVEKSPVDFHYVCVMNLNDVLSALWSSEASQLHLQQQESLQNEMKKSHISITWNGVWGLQKQRHALAMVPTV